MPGWFRNYSPQRFLISFALAAFVSVIPEGSIFKAYSDAIEEVRQDEHGEH